MDREIARGSEVGAWPCSAAVMALPGVGKGGVFSIQGKNHRYHVEKDGIRDLLLILYKWINVVNMKRKTVKLLGKKEETILGTSGKEKKHEAQTLKEKTNTFNYIKIKHFFIKTNNKQKTVKSMLKGKL